MKMTDRQAYNQNKRTIRWLNRFKLGSGAEENYDHAIEALKRANDALDSKIRNFNKSALPADEICNRIQQYQFRIFVKYSKQPIIRVVGIGDVVEIRCDGDVIFIICRGTYK